MTKVEKYKELQRLFQAPTSAPPRIHRSEHPVLYLPEESLSIGKIEQGVHESLAQIENAGGGTLKIEQIKPDVAWLQIAHYSQEITEIPGSIKVRIDAEGLKPGQYTAHLEIHSNSMYKPDAQIAIALEVLSRPDWEIDGLEGAALDFGELPYFKEVEFSYFDPTASTVLLAGDFTGWHNHPISMEKHGDIFKAWVPLDDGTYYYGFEVDGRKIHDPNRPQVAQSGGPSSRIELNRFEKKIRLRSLRAKGTTKLSLSASANWLELEPKTVNLGPKDEKEIACKVNLSLMKFGDNSAPVKIAAANGQPERIDFQAKGKTTSQRIVPMVREQEVHCGAIKKGDKLSLPIKIQTYGTGKLVGKIFNEDGLVKPVDFAIENRNLGESNVYEQAFEVDTAKIQKAGAQNLQVIVESDCPLQKHRRISISYKFEVKEEKPPVIPPIKKPPARETIDRPRKTPIPVPTPSRRPAVPWLVAAAIIVSVAAFFIFWSGNAKLEAIPSASKFQAMANDTIAFSDKSKGNVVGRQWDFGDNTPVSTEQNPSHVYSTPGDYQVALKIWDSDSKEATSEPFTIHVSPVSEPEPVTVQEPQAPVVPEERPASMGNHDLISADSIRAIGEAMGVSPEAIAQCLQINNRPDDEKSEFRGLITNYDPRDPRDVYNKWKKWYEFADPKHAPNFPDSPANRFAKEVADSLLNQL